MKKVRNMLNYVPYEGKTFTQPSQTVPDQTMSLRTIMNRYASGLPVGGIKEAIWDDDAENALGVNPKSLDLVDMQAMKIDVDEFINEVKVKSKSVKTQPKAENELSEEAESTNLT